MLKKKKRIFENFRANFFDIKRNWPEMPHILCNYTSLELLDWVYNLIADNIYESCKFDT